MTSIVISNSAGTAIRHQPENRCMGANAAVCIDTLHAVRSWIGDSGAIGRLQHCTRERERQRRAWIGFAHHKIVIARHSLRPPAESEFHLACLHISGKTPGHFKMKPGTQKALRDQLRTWVAKNLLLAFTFSGVSLGIILGICLRWERENAPSMSSYLCISSYHPQTAQLGPAHHRLHLLSRGAIHAASQTHDSSPHHRFSHHR